MRGLKEIGRAGRKAGENVQLNEMNFQKKKLSNVVFGRGYIKKFSLFKFALILGHLSAAGIEDSKTQRRPDEPSLKSHLQKWIS